MIKRTIQKKEDTRNITVTIKNDRVGTIRIVCSIAIDHIDAAKDHINKKLNSDFSYHWSAICDSLLSIVPESTREKTAGEIAAILIRDSFNKELSEHVYDVSSC